MELQDQLAEAFMRFVVAQREDTPICALAECIAEGRLQRQDFDYVLHQYDIEDWGELTPELLDLVLVGIRASLRDNWLSPEEREQVRRLKWFLRIRPGAFHEHRREEIRDLLAGEVHRLLIDDSVDNVESLYQVSLQEIFDLSYDQYLDLTREEVATVVDRLLVSARGQSSNEQKRHFHAQLSALNTVYVLSPEQREALDRLDQFRS